LQFLVSGARLCAVPPQKFCYNTVALLDPGSAALHNILYHACIGNTADVYGSLTVLGTKLCFFPAAVLILGVLGVLGVGGASVNGMLGVSLVVSDWSVVLSIHTGATAITTHHSQIPQFREM